MNAKINNTQIFWFTGLSGAGKSTIAQGVASVLQQKDYKVLILDGDTIREKITKNLGFSKEDILANNYKVIELCKKEFLEEYDFILVAVIAPFEESRKRAREELGNCFHEVYIKASIDQVKKRDVKGLYEKALKGEIKNFIGIDENVPYQVPSNPHFVIDTELQEVQESIENMIQYIQNIDASKTFYTKE